MEGPQICRKYRDNKGAAPIIMLTGRAAMDEKLAGFDSGADDYLTKPFSMIELGARVKALLRRGRHLEEDILQAHGIVLDPTKFSVSKNGVELSLLPKEMCIRDRIMAPSRALAAVKKLSL